MGCLANMHTYQNGFMEDRESPIRKQKKKDFDVT